VARAQIYHLNNIKVPGNRSLHTLYAFYVFSHEEAPERPFGQPIVKFHEIAGTPGSTMPTVGKVEDYIGVQISIMKYADFWKRINPKRFCCNVDDVAKGLCEQPSELMVTKDKGATYRDVDVYIKTARFNSPIVAPADEKESIRRTGVYILIVSNCGDYSDANVGGQIIVRNSYGYLPGNEYHKMPFYGWLLLVYVGLAVIWMVLSLRWWKELFSIQNCVTAVIFFGLVEALLWYIFFNDWNTSGVRGRALFITSILSSVVKSIFSYMLVLVAALGWGVTRPFLDRSTILKIQAVCFLYIVLDFIREAVLSFRHSHSLSLVFVLLCLLPVSLLNGGIFYWVFTALSGLMETLKERRQFEKLNLFEKLWKVLVAALAVATLTLLLQIFNLSRSITTRWKYQWLFADAVSHVLFVVVLVAMMYLWAPHKYSQRFAYSMQVDQVDRDDDPKESTDVWAEEGGLDEDGEDGESFWATTKRDGNKDSKTDSEENKASPDVIGADADTEKL
jgi:hypothetical protein